MSKRNALDDKENKQGQHNTSKQTNFLTPAPREPPDKKHGNCKVNIVPLID